MFPVALLILASLGNAQNPSETSVIRQSTSGWCSPVFANVTGPITVTCKGIDPSAVKVLNEQLHRSKTSLVEAMKRADEWAEKYFELESKLSSTTSHADLRSKALQFLRSGDLTNAGSTIDEILHSEEKDLLRGAADDEYARATVFDLQGDNLNAFSHFERAYQIDPDNLKYAMNYGRLLIENRDFHVAESVLTKALNACKVLALTDRPKFLEIMAMIQMNLGDLYRHTNRSDDATNAYQNASSLLYEIGVSRTYENNLNIANVQASLALLYTQEMRPTDAAKAMEQSISLLTLFMQVWPIDHPGEENPFPVIIARVKANLGAIYADLGRSDLAVSYLTDSTATFKALAAGNHAVYDIRVSEDEFSLGQIYSTSGDTKRGQLLIEDSLRIIESLAAQSPAEYEHLHVATLVGLSNSYLLSKDNDKAELLLAKAEKICLDNNEKDPSDFQPLHVAILNNLSIVRANQSRFSEAISLLDEALILIRSMRKKDTALHLDLFIQSLGLQARNCVAQSDFLRARADYLEEISNLKEMLQRKPPTFYFFDLASSLLEAARNEVKLGDKNRAKMLANDSVDIWIKLFHQGHS